MDIAAQFGFVSKFLLFEHRRGRSPPLSLQAQGLTYVAEVLFHLTMYDMYMYMYI